MDNLHIRITIAVTEMDGLWDHLAEATLRAEAPAEILASLLDPYTIGQAVSATVAAARAKLAAQESEAA